MIDDLFYDHNETGYCFGHGWYLSNDFQIFLLTPLLLILYVKKPKVCIALLISMFAGSIITAYIMSYHYDYHIQMTSKENYTQMPTY